ncbi:MAG: F0F1 ATP synthase subunit A [Phycisphaerales bacterium]
MFFFAAGDSLNPLGHVLDITLIGGDKPVFKATAGMPELLTMHMVTLLAASVVALLLLATAAKAIATGPERDGHRRYVSGTRLGQFIEVIVLYMRDNVIVPVIGEAYGRRYLPLLLSIFFFILVNNLFGLIPILDINHILGQIFFKDKSWAVIGGTATANIAVTAALATIAFFVVNIHGIKDLGVGGFLHHLLGGAPAFLAPIMVPIEIAGLIIKPVALAIRLFANMLAGHTLMATLGLFAVITVNTIGESTTGYVAGTGVGIIAAIGAVAIYFLEIFVAFLQAFIFMFLTTIFIGQLTHHHDDHDHADDHAADGAVAAH